MDNAAHDHAAGHTAPGGNSAGSVTDANNGAAAGQSSWNLAAQAAPGEPPFTAKDRLLSTTHPHVMYGFSAGTVVVSAVIGAVLMYRSVGAGIALVVGGVVSAAATFLPAHWSERHPDRARRYIRAQTQSRNQLARRHPSYFLVALPVTVAISAAARFNHGHHGTVLSWTLPAAIALALGIAIGAVLVHRARHAQPTRR